MQRLSKKVLVGLALALVVSMLVALPALASNGHGPKATATYGSCSVTPNPATVGGMYTVVGSGFTNGGYLNVFVEDSMGTTVLIPYVNSLGDFSVSTYASYTGTYNVSVYDISGKKRVYLAGCSFQVN